MFWSEFYKMIYCVEDDAGIRDMMIYALNVAGFEAHGFENGKLFFDEIKKKIPRLIMLDIMLPDEDGLTILKKLRSNPSTSSVPVIMATAKGTEYDKVVGLDLGADDYLAKPFHLAELSARIRSVARRSRNDGELTYKAGNVVLEDVSQRLTVAGKEVSLLKKEFDILKYFLMRPGHTVDKAVLAEAVWGDHIDQSDDFQFVYAQMKNLRRKLSEAGADIEIKSIYGFGYKLLIP
jgi:DNA-binding response OmpR family regulator